MARFANLNARFVLTLQDHVSRGLGALKSRLDGLAAGARQIGLLGAGFAAISLAGPIAQAAAFDTQLRDLANTHGLTGAAADRFMTAEGRRIEGLARQYRLLSRDLMGANNVLAANALESEDRIRLLPEIARLSAAERVAADDAARLGVSLIQNLRIPAERIGPAFAQITQAGREGAVEIRDMANGFPALATAAAGVGMTGERALQQITAALEIARRGAPDAATAINNLRNVFAKLTAPETVRNFEQFNINLPAVLEDASRKGISALDAVLEHVRRKAGNDPIRLAQMFGDMQAIEGLRPILQNLQAMLTMREQIAQANEGILDEGLALRLRGWASEMRGAEEASEQLSRRLGAGLAPSLGIVNAGLWAAVDAFDWMEAAYPGVVGGVLATAGGMALLAGGLGAAVPLLGFLVSGVGLLMAPLRMLLMPLRLVMAGLVAIGVPMTIAAAAVAVLATALAAAAFHIWRNWDRFAGYFSTMWQGIRRIFGGFIDFVLGAFTGDTRRVIAGLSDLWDGVRSMFAGLWGVVRRLFNDFVAWVDGWSGGPMKRGVDTIKELWEGLKSFFNGLWAEVEARFDRFVGRIVDFFRPLTDLLDRLRSATTVPGDTGQQQMSPEEQRQRAASMMDGAGAYPPEAAVSGRGGLAAARATVSGNISIRLAPGLVIHEANADQPGLTFEPQGSRGAVVGRY